MVAHPEALIHTPLTRKRASWTGPRDRIILWSRLDLLARRPGHL